MLQLKVKITFRDDKQVTYDCVDTPAIGEWITLYLKGFRRKLLRSEGIAEIEYYFIDGKLK